MTLDPAGANVKVSVVVPARNEEALIGACLKALATQENIAPEEYEVILVLDNCTDATENRAREVSRTYPELRLRFLEGPGKGAGHARRVGMEAACQRLLELDKPSALIASTDADTVVAPDWLSTQLECAARGARAIGGRIELADEESLPEGVAHWRNDQGKTRHQNLLAEKDKVRSNVMEHWQFSGASLALTAAVYKEIGGLEPLTALEDEYLERILRQRGVPIERPLAVNVRTSARRNGRAERGLAQDLALASWFHDNTYKATDFSLNRLRKAKRFSASLILVGDEYSSEALCEISHLRDCGLLDEVLRVVPRSEENGVPTSISLYPAEDLLPQFGPIRGYGDLLWRGLSAARGELFVTLDAGREDSIAERICGLLGPMVKRDGLSLVKSFGFTPSLLSNLVGRPLLNLYRPKLAGFVEPLSRDFAAKTRLLKSLPFPVGSGVDISLLLDGAEKANVDALAQTRVRDGARGPRRNDGEDAYAILSAAMSRSPGARSEELIPGPFFSPGPQDLATQRVPVEERPPLESLNAKAKDSAL